MNMGDLEELAHHIKTQDVYLSHITKLSNEIERLRTLNAKLVESLKDLVGRVTDEAGEGPGSPHRNERREVTPESAQLVAAVRKILEGLDETIRDGGGHYEESAARRDAAMLREALAQVGRPQFPQSTGRWHVVRQYSNGCETGPAIYLDNQWMATIVGAPHLGFRSVEIAERICAAMNGETSVAAEPPRPAAIEQAIRDYYFALDNREHGGVAANMALNRIQEVLGIQWHQGEEKRLREET